MINASHPLKAYRERQTPPLTQDALATALGVTKATVCRWERGERFPDRQFWSRIRDVTGLGPEALSTAHDNRPDEAAA